MRRTASLLRLLRALAVVGALTLVVGMVIHGTSEAAAPAAVTWAPAASATVHPGVETFTEGSQCTSNFVFSDGTNVYVGQAAHCAGTGGNTDTDGCTSPTLPVGTPVTISGATEPGTLVYSSWVTMQQDHEGDANTCAYNDLALVKVAAADVGAVNPTIPVWGGPAGVSTGGTTLGERVFS
ncbi:MAG TPA: hypothetical protein VLZ77_03065 [Acidimicrobiales bacterium]|nr:hypothetical protein [Acidimicrobiales bacterium]